MISAWKRRRDHGRRATKKGLLESNLEMELTIPAHFRCPISLDLMKDPVTLSTGITYDRDSIEKWIESGNQTCPVTNQLLTTFDQIPNHAIRKMIQDWCVQNHSSGIERIPTPRIPVAPYEVLEICSRIKAATQRGDANKCRDLVGKIKRWGKESERNKKCIVENGTGFVLSASFESFASDSIEKHSFLLEDILSILRWMFPLGEEGQSKLGSAASLRCMVWFLKGGSDLSARQSSVLVLRELLSLDQRHVEALGQIEGLVDALFMIIKKPICPTTTKAALMVVIYMISPSSTSEKFASRFVEMGLVPLVLEILVDAERSICEKALGVMDRICDYGEGREKAYHSALTMPVLVKKLIRVSNLATEISISVLWKLCKNENRDEGGAMIEALQVGAFQKVLVILQVGCGERTKEKVTELLKLLNLYRGKVDCFDSSMDFKYLKRPF